MTVLIALILVPFALLTICFAIELFVGLRPLPTCDAGVGSPRAVIVVPAHDEAAVLEPRLAALKSAAGSQAQILLVADNCNDATADIARGIGVNVIERTDREHRGKGFALDFARQMLSAAPPDVVLIVDADCSMDGASIGQIIRHCAASGKPCQATNLQAADLSASPAVQLSTFAFFVKNVIRQRALKRLAGQVQLLGTGMALPWQLFSGAKLATSSIVEDIKLGQELAAAGHPPVLVETATVWSNAETTRNTLAQRQRWEGGFLNEALRHGPSRFIRAAVRGDAAAMWSALSVMIPPFALLLLVDFALLTIAALMLLIAGRSTWPILVMAIPIFLAAVALAFAWRWGGSRFVSVAGLARAPLYILWKLPMYLGFARRGVPKEWSRTNRG